MTLNQIDTDGLRTLLSHAVPVLFLASSLLAGRSTLRPATSWSAARLTAILGLCLALGAFAASIAHVVEAGIDAGRTGLVQASVLVLVGFLGWVLSRYSSTYLEGEPRQQGFVRWFLATLAGSSLVVATDHLVVLAIAWLGASLSLQNLLTFYDERPAARMAAYKKFLASRAADTCVLLAALLFALGAGTVKISALGEAAVDLPVLLGMMLLGVAVLLKSAQLPVHGWLMQVMEAPTPVSALLHAGVVNLGGFVLIRFAPLLERVPAAQAMLVIVGGATAVLAGLILSTRISIKVALAWSTCAQMGFMVVQCGLGLYEMALLHLIGHSLYKAHAFLAAGGTVAKARIKGMTEVPPAQSPVRIAMVAIVTVALVLRAIFALGSGGTVDPALAAMGIVVALAVQPLMAHAIGVIQSVLVAVAYFGLHALLHPLSPTAAAGAAEATPLRLALSAFIAFSFVLLFRMQHSGVFQSDSERSQRLQARFHGGLFLDEWFTRLTLRIFPVRTGGSR